jgi:large subunit ribosomal protein L15
MSDYTIRPPAGAKKNRKRVGRGTGSGLGTTAGRGNKGQQSRSGGKVYVGFEGGQMPLYRRIAQRGFSNYPFRKDYEALNVRDLERKYSDGETVDVGTLIQKGLIKNARLPVKILGTGELTKKLTVLVAKASASAKEKIEKAGGTVTEKE